MSDHTIDFFGAQDRAKANTFKLVVLFILAVIFLCFGIFVIVDVVYVYSTKDTEELGVNFQDFLNLDILLYSVIGTMALISIAMAFKVASLSGGGEKVASMLGGTKVYPGTTDPQKIQLLNIVEEMAIASGVPTPDVYIMAEESINAFAAGSQIEDAVIGVTQGCLNKLTRDELQGVIAHEFSHILNNDMRLNIKLMGIVFGIMVIAVIGRYMLEFGARNAAYRSNKDKGNGLVVVGLAVFTLGSVGLFFSRWIKGSISREREYLADASAVQFTRNPQGIAGALKKIGGAPERSRIKAAAAEEASHMFFGNAMKVNFIFSTHPPLETRIARIDPSWDGQYLTPSEISIQGESETQQRKEKPKAQVLNIPGLPGNENSPIPGGIIAQTAILDEAAKKNMASALEDVENHIGNPSNLQLNYAQELMKELPDYLLEAIHNPMGATVTIFALLLDRKKPDIFESQINLIENHGPKGWVSEVKKVSAFILDLDPKFFLPLAELAAPALRELSPNQYSDFKKITKLLIEEDRAIDLLEYSIDKMLEASLDIHFEPNRKQVIQYYNPIGVTEEIKKLISCLAYEGHEDFKEAERAFAKGISSFSEIKGFDQLEILEQSQSSFSEVDKALKKIKACSLPVRKKIIQAAGRTIAADGQITIVEAELIRAVCYSLGCPVPPFAGH